MNYLKHPETGSGVHRGEVERAPTETAREALLRENVDRENVHVTGNTVIDALHWVTARIAQEPSLACGLADLEARFAGKRIIGMTSHRRENFGEGMQNIANAVKDIASRDDVAVIFPVHLNPNVRAVMNEQLAGLDNVALIEPLEILRAVRGYNELARIVIHTIAIGDFQKAFLEQLATENGGVFVDMGR